MIEDNTAYSSTLDQYSSDHGPTAGPVDLVGDHNRLIHGENWTARDWFLDPASNPKSMVETPMDCFWEGSCDLYRWLLALT